MDPSATRSREGSGLGVLFAVHSAVSQGVAIVVGHSGFAGVDVLPGTVVRLAAGLAGALALATLVELRGRGARRDGESGLAGLLRPFASARLARRLFWPAFFAALVTLPMHSYALRDAPGGVSAVLFATTPLYTLPLGLALGERPGWRTLLGTLVGFAGVAGVILLGSGAHGQGAASGATAELVVTPLETPAGPGSLCPNLVRGPDGRVVLSWVERTEGARAALKLARREGDGWGPVRTVVAGDDLFVNWADFPSVGLLADGTLLAQWLRESSAEGAGRGAYDVVFALSHDGGATWSEPRTLHDDLAPAEHGFVSLVPLDAEHFGAIWLDGRHLGAPIEDGGGQDGDETEAGSIGMELLWRTIARDGELGPEQEVDGRACACCSTDLALTEGGGLLAVWRDRSAEEVRDTSAAIFREGAWSAPRTVHADGWTLWQCPVNGPALTVAGERAAVVWYTEAEGEGRVQLGLVRPDEPVATFPLTVDEGRPLGRQDVVTLADGSLLVVWLENEEEGAAWRARRVAANGEQGASVVVGRVPASRVSGFARVVQDDSAGEGGALVVWTVPGDPSRVELARVAPE